MGFDLDMEQPAPMPDEAVAEKSQETPSGAPETKEPVVDRHHGYSSTTSLEFGPRKKLFQAMEPLSPSKPKHADSTIDDCSVPVSPSSLLRRAKPAPSSRSVKSFNSTAQSVKSAMSASTGMSTCSANSQRSHESGGVSIRLDFLHREDSIPCQLSGKRNYSAKDNIIRIFLLLPGQGHKYALWVDPYLPVGPKPTVKNRFTALWGPDAEEVGPDGMVANVPQKRRPVHDMSKGVPLNPHLQQIKSERAQEESTVVALGLSPRKIKKDRQKRDIDGQNFRAIVYDTTGIEPEMQELVFASRRLTDDAKCISDYGVGQGAVVLCSRKEEHGHELELATTHAKTQPRSVVKFFEKGPPKGPISGKLASLAQGLSTDMNKSSGSVSPMNMPSRGFRLMQRWQTDQNPRLLEAEPTAVLSPSGNNIYTHEFGGMADHGATANCHLIRKMHGIT